MKPIAIAVSIEDTFSPITLSVVITNGEQAATMVGMLKAATIDSDSAPQIDLAEDLISAVVQATGGT